MKELTIMLNNVKDSYYDFVVAVLNYARKKQSRLENVKDFMISNPDASTSDILEYISNQADFFEDAAFDEAKAG
jgi:hypothetical protein